MALLMKPCYTHTYDYIHGHFPGMPGSADGPLTQRSSKKPFKIDGAVFLQTIIMSFLSTKSVKILETATEGRLHQPYLSSSRDQLLLLMPELICTYKDKYGWP